jgi:GntR family transcriptional regulator/MocR family aminotransferase
MVAPPAVLSAVLAHRDAAGTGPAPAGQLVLVELARHGDLGRHLRRLRRELSERRSILVDALVAGGVPVLGDEAGAHVVVLVSSAEEERELLAAAGRRGLLLDGLARHHCGRPRWFGVALGYAACSRDQLQDALPVLVDLLRR